MSCSMLNIKTESSGLTYLGYTAIILTTVYTVIITILGLNSMQKVKYIYKSTKMRIEDNEILPTFLRFSLS